MTMYSFKNCKKRGKIQNWRNFVMKSSMILKNKTYSRRWIPFRKRWIRRTWRSFADEITRLVFIDVWKMFKNNICSLGSSGHGWLDKVHCQWIWVPILVFGSFRFHMLYKLPNTLAGNIGLFLACKYIVWKKMVILVIIVIKQVCYSNSSWNTEQKFSNKNGQLSFALLFLNFHT